MTEPGKDLDQLFTAAIEADGRLAAAILTRDRAQQALESATAALHRAELAASLANGRYMSRAADGVPYEPNGRPLIRAMLTARRDLTAALAANRAKGPLHSGPVSPRHSFVHGHVPGTVVAHFPTGATVYEFNRSGLAILSQPHDPDAPPKANDWRPWAPPCATCAQEFQAALEHAIESMWPHNKPRRLFFERGVDPGTVFCSDVHCDPYIFRRGPSGTILSQRGKHSTVPVPGAWRQDWLRPATIRQLDAAMTAMWPTLPPGFGATDTR